MSAAIPPNTPRRPTPTPRPATAATARPVRPALQSSAATWSDEDEPEFRLNLSDIPFMRGTMHVEGLKPTLLSRLLDLVAPLRP
jgi:hypothetical protein